jgi:hypothetical protein
MRDKIVKIGIVIGIVLTMGFSCLEDPRCEGEMVEVCGPTEAFPDGHCWYVCEKGE